MKHVKLFENFLFEKTVDKLELAKKIKSLIQKSPLAMKSVGYCTTLYKAMKGFTTDEAAIYSVFSKIKTKGEMIQVIAIWDMCVSNMQDLALANEIFAGEGNNTTGDYDLELIANNLDKMGQPIKDTLNNLDFWNKADTRSTDAYMKARAAYYKSSAGPKFKRKTTLVWWLREDLEDEELAKLNGMIKKFGMEISSEYINHSHTIVNDLY